MKNRINRFFYFLIILILSLFLASCNFLQREQIDISVTVYIDGAAHIVEVPAGSTALDALEAAGIVIDLDDRSEPPFYTVLSNGSEVNFIQVEEEFVVEESIIPYESQELRNESLPEGERRLIQPGVNGLQETTYRIVLENGIEVSRSAMNTVIVQSPKAEVIMVGSQGAFAVISIPGILAYLSGGNAWVMEGNTGNRRPVVTTGDLDGRVFSISPDGEWLLYTRSDEAEDVINSLWVTSLVDSELVTYDLRVGNIIHFGDFVPYEDNYVIFSTGDFSPSPPGWQAKNDLQLLNFSDKGWVTAPRIVIRKSSGGVYGWWGGQYVWSPNGEKLAYSRPDSIGLVNLDTESLIPLFDILPVQTRSEWAWVPEVSWSPDGNYLYFVNHAPQEGLVSGEDSPLFDLAVIPLVGGAPITLVTEVGMFANPLPSPPRFLPDGEMAYYIAYLQALIPTQSRTSGYRLMIMDRDGSNAKAVFPPEGNPGLSPQKYFWSPLAEDEEFTPLILLIYQGNLWVVNVEDGTSQQLSGDGLITAIDWQ